VEPVPITIETEQRRDMALEYVQPSPDTPELFELSFSSEYPVERYFGSEILDHSAGAVDLSRAQNGACPLLLNHNQYELIGKVEKAWIDPQTRKGRALVRLDTVGELGQRSLAQVKDGILSNVSCFYKIRAHREDYRQDTPTPQVTVTKWELIEISLVSCPEDPTVGIGRSMNTAYQATVGSLQRGQGKVTVGTEEKIDIEQERAKIRQAEQERIRHISAMPGHWGPKIPGGVARAQQIADKAIADGIPEQEARNLITDLILQPEPQSISRPAPQLDLSPKEQRRYSLSRAFKVAATRFYPDLDVKDCSFEIECSRAIAEGIGAQAKGLFVPINDLVINGRDAARGQMLMEGQRASFTAGTPNLGGNTIETMLDTNRMVDFLFNAPRCKEAGMTMLMGLQGNVDIPTEDGSGLGIVWVAEDGSIAETNSTFGILNMRPKTAGAYMRVTQRMLQQSELAMESYMRSRLQIAMALGIDNAVIRGTGLSNQPTGILNTPGIGTVALGVNGGAPTYDSLVDIETLFGDNNIDQLGNGPTWMVNSKGRGKLRKTLQNNISGADYLWKSGGVAGDGELLDYRALTTNQIPSNLTKGTGTNLSALIAGYWNQVYLGQWGVLDIMANPYGDTDFVKGAIKIRIMMTIDILVARAKAFAAITDMITI
jgi:HK97 family phage major capsid protein